MKSALQDWVANLGIRHQTLLICAMRGCDTSPKEGVGKNFLRCLRGLVLTSFYDDPELSGPFMMTVEPIREMKFAAEIVNDCDHFPVHYLTHLIHAIAVVAYHYPDPEVSDRWRTYYSRFCDRLHLKPESMTQMDARLNAR